MEKTKDDGTRSAHTDSLKRRGRAVRELLGMDDNAIGYPLHPPALAVGRFEHGPRNSRGRRRPCALPPQSSVMIVTDSSLHL